jgi:hypothetical protein
MISATDPALQINLKAGVAMQLMKNYVPSANRYILFYYILCQTLRQVVNKPSQNASCCF